MQMQKQSCQAIPLIEGIYFTGFYRLEMPLKYRDILLRFRLYIYVDDIKKDAAIL
jgi:hypothetical protein